jgi:hypothetical protein
MYLFRQFSCGFQDKNAWFFMCGMAQPLQYRQYKGRCFPGSGRRQSQNITPLKDDGDCLPLNGCWCGISGSPNGRSDRRFKTKMFEIQKVLPDSIEPSRTLSPVMILEFVSLVAVHSQKFTNLFYFSTFKPTNPERILQALSRKSFHLKME